MGIRAFLTYERDQDHLGRRLLDKAADLDEDNGAPSVKTLILDEVREPFPHAQPIGRLDFSVQ